MKRLTLALIVMGSGLFWSEAAEAQRLPFQRSDQDQVEARFRALLLTQFQETLQEWTRAINAGDVDAAADLYADDAFFYLGKAVRGSPAIREALSERAASLRGMQVGLAGFEGSSRVSYGSAYVRLPSSVTAPDRSGTMVLVMRREGNDTWKIRSQTILLE